MRVDRAEFVVSLSGYGEFPGWGRPEIAMLGRSNVGKSSLINALANRKALARTSSEPGKTRLVNVYGINRAFFLLDFPGYGYAKASKAEKSRWDERAGGYLEAGEHVRLALLLIDIRHPPSEGDRGAAAYLRHLGIPFAVVATKADKLSRAAIERQIPILCRALGAQPWELIPCSARGGIGLDRVWTRIEEALGAEPPVRPLNPPNTPSRASRASADADPRPR